jgi:hypothetical protein
VKIKAQVFPYDTDISHQKVVALLQQLTDTRFIIQYSVNAHNYIQLRTFTKHQHCHLREGDSLIPPPSEAPYKPGASPVPEEEAPYKPGASPEKAVLEPAKPVASTSTSTSTSTNGVMENGVLVPGKPGAGLGAMFCEFWEVYPRKENKKSAWEAFQKIHPTRELMNNWWIWLEQAKASNQWMDKDKIPHPSVWLNQRRWEGDPPPAPTAVCHIKSETPMQKHQREMEEIINAKQKDS